MRDLDEGDGCAVVVAIVMFIIAAANFGFGLAVILACAIIIAVWALSIWHEVHESNERSKKLAKESSRQERLFEQREILLGAPDVQLNIETVKAIFTSVADGNAVKSTDIICASRTAYIKIIHSGVSRRLNECGGAPSFMFSIAGGEAFLEYYAEPDFSNTAALRGNETFFSKSTPASKEISNSILICGIFVNDGQIVNEGDILCAYTRDADLIRALDADFINGSLESVITSLGGNKNIDTCNNKNAIARADESQNATLLHERREDLLRRDASEIWNPNQSIDDIALMFSHIDLESGIVLKPDRILAQSSGCVHYTVEAFLCGLFSNVIENSNSAFFELRVDCESRPHEAILQKDLVGKSILWIPLIEDGSPIVIGTTLALVTSYGGRLCNEIQKEYVQGRFGRQGDLPFHHKKRQILENIEKLRIHPMYIFDETLGGN